MNQIKWSNRYSDTLEDDKFGRWAVVGYTGNFKKVDETYQICWISKVNIYEDIRFQIKADFPFKGKFIHTDLDEAKKEVELYFSKFIKSVKR